MRRLSLCLAVTVVGLVAVPRTLADGPIYVTVGGAGVTSHDGAARYVAVPTGKRGTLLEKIGVAQGRVFWWMRLRGSWGTPEIGTGTLTGQGFSRDGRTLVLASTSGPFASPSRFLVVDPKRAKILRTVMLPGSFSFDAISPDGSLMYLIQYTHAGSNDLVHYIVRGYDLRTNRLVPGKIADRREDEGPMAGYALTRTTSADGRWVYTLYQKPNGEPFVHALDTVRAAAYCVDLPSSPQTNQALANVVLSLRNHDGTLAVHWRSGRPWLNVAVGSWQVSLPGVAGFPWAWVGGGIGGGLVLLCVGGALFLRRRRGKKLHEQAGHEIGLA